MEAPTAPRPPPPWGVIAIVTLIVCGLFVLGYIYYYKPPAPVPAPLPACPKSLITITNSTSNTSTTYGPGVYDIDQYKYNLTVYPPLQVTAYGPTGDMQRTNYFLPDGVQCGQPVKLVLDKEKNYNAVAVAKI